MAVYCDSDFLTYDLTTTDPVKRVDNMLVKYNGVSIVSEWDKLPNEWDMGENGNWAWGTGDFDSGLTKNILMFFFFYFKYMYWYKS